MIKTKVIRLLSIRSAPFCTLYDPKTDYYAILGVDRTATNDEIKLIFRRQAKEFHPDSHGGQFEEKFKAINNAYNILSNKELRKLYDNSRCMNGVWCHFDANDSAAQTTPCPDEKIDKPNKTTIDKEYFKSNNKKTTEEQRKPRDASFGLVAFLFGGSVFSAMGIYNTTKRHHVSLNSLRV